MTKQTKATLAAMLGYSIFGFSFLFSKLALEMASPFILLAVRFVAAFLVMNILRLTGLVQVSLKGKPVGLLMMMGLVHPVIYFICETYGIAMTTAAFSGIMIGMAPVFGLIFGVLFLKERCSALQVVFTVCSVIGAAMTTTGGVGKVPAAGFFLLLGALICSSLLPILSRKIADHFSAFERTYVMFAFGSITFTAIALLQNAGDLTAITEPLSQGKFWISILYLAVASSVVAFLSINYSATHIPAGRTIVFSNCVPVISVLAGIFIMGDSFTAVQLLGIAVIVISVFGVSYPGKEAAKS